LISRSARQGRPTMSTNERVRRPVLERTQPIRNWSNAVSTAPGTPGQQIGQDVQNANRVIEDYMSAGRASAGRFTASNRAASVLGSTEEVAQRMVRAASDSVNLWLEFMARSTGGAVQPQEHGGPSPSPAAQAAPAHVPETELRVAVDVDSIRPTTVSLNLGPDARRSKLSVDRLHPRGSSVTPLTGVEINTAKREVVTVRLRVDPAQPAGLYHGVILDEATSLPAGTISVEIKSRRPASRPKRKR
jgi:hypothetical protein